MLFGWILKRIVGDDVLDLMVESNQSSQGMFSIQRSYFAWIVCVIIAGFGIITVANYICCKLSHFRVNQENEGITDCQ